MFKKAIYDDIAEEYKESKNLAIRSIDQYTLFKLLGDPKGKNIIDLACGEGFFSRKIKEKGASDVLGIDISKEMIKFAEESENQTPLGCKYLVYDILKLNTIGSFDIAFVSFLLNYAKTKAELQKFCQVIYKNLAPNGRVVGINDNPHIAKQIDYRQYGFTREFRHMSDDGSPIDLTFFLPDDTKFTITIYYFSPQTYIEAFEAAGFRHFQWHGPWIPEEDSKRYPENYFKTFLQNPPSIGFEAFK